MGDVDRAIPMIIFGEQPPGAVHISPERPIPKDDDQKFRSSQYAKANTPLMLSSTELRNGSQEKAKTFVRLSSSSFH